MRSKNRGKEMQKKVCGSKLCESKDWRKKKLLFLLGPVIKLTMFLSSTLVTSCVMISSTVTSAACRIVEEYVCWMRDLSSSKVRGWLLMLKNTVKLPVNSWRKRKYLEGSLLGNSRKKSRNKSKFKVRNLLRDLLRVVNQIVSKRDQICCLPWALDNNQRCSGFHRITSSPM